MIRAAFVITLHIKDTPLLLMIKSVFGVGTIIFDEKRESVRYEVTSLKDLTNVIIPHFEKYPLLTQKRADYELFKKVVELMNQKEHLTTEGLNNIMSLRASINKGLTEVLKEAFPDVKPVERPVVQLPKSIHPE